MREAAEKAFQLAHFIHRDRRLAVCITADALSRLKLSVSRQRKRRYYLPLRRVRTKVSLGELQELQLLVFLESETHEIRQEEEACEGLRDADWVIRFVKHLVAITVNRSAFYVALGLGRLLFSYSTTEVIDIYDAVRQDAERAKDEPYFRKQKAILMRQIKERFGTVLQTCRVSHGEERFVTRDDSARCAPLVRQCLDMFTPWGTSCVLPERFDPVSDTINALRFDGGEPDGEHPVEVRRMHALLHPDCFQLLVTALGFAPPTQCLSVPVFFCSGSVDVGRNDGGGTPSGLLDADLSEVRRLVKKQTARRRKVASDSLSVSVDGAERVTLELDDPNPARLAVGGDARVIEVNGRDECGEVLLANFLLSGGELLRARPSKEYSFRLARARRLLLSVSPRVDAEGEIEGADVELAYRRVGTFGVILKFWEESGVTRPTLAFGAVGLALLIVAGVLTCVRFLIKRSPASQPAFEYAAQLKQPPTQPHVSGADSGRQDSQPEKGQGNTRQPEQGSRKPSKPTASVNAASRSGRTSQSKEGVRDFNFESVKELLSVKLVYVEEHAKGGDAELRESFVSRIAESRRLLVSGEPRQADAFLFWSLRRTPAGRRIKARLTDRRGRELWSGSQLIRGATSNREAASQAASKLAQNLLDEIARREGTPK
jgi:hypothetical protein